jgi:hypothetical protein
MRNAGIEIDAPFTIVSYPKIAAEDNPTHAERD